MSNPPNTSAATVEQPGRNCPIGYRYSPAVFRRAPELHGDTLYVVGGLYGNSFALDRIVEMAGAEAGRVEIVFNGDFNWFDVDADSFAAINLTVLRYIALRGNVETELAHDDAAGGCGCAYPDWVDDAVVDRSNQITQLLRATARRYAPLRRELAALPMHLVAEVGGVRIAVVHGDAESLSGWSFAQETLSVGTGDAALARCFDAAAVSLFACTHTCLPVLKRVALADRAGAIVNNGSAGMPNLAGTNFGLITRIATTPAAHACAGSWRVGDLHVDLLKVEYDQARWRAWFEKTWPPGSPAYLSYFKRIVDGPTFAGPIEV